MRFFPLIAATLFAAALHAAPFVPANDSDVLETLPEKGDATLASLKRMREAARARPDDLGLATAFARRAIQASRASGDPRHLGQARAALAPWWNASDAPHDALLLRATIKQSLHDFDGALADLDRLLAEAPHDAQARLTRATVRNVIGRHADAIADCEALPAGTAPLVGVTCRADAASRAGRAAESYERVAAALVRERAVDPGLRAWAATVAAEIAERRGDPTGAERHFRTALALDAGDPYALGAYADFLLDAGRSRDVVALLSSHVRNDALLLRLVLATRDVDRDAHAKLHGELAARVDASRRRGDGVHLRDEARYALAVEGDADAALRLAQANWRAQREPADLRLLAKAARAAGDRAALRTVDAWMRGSRLEDARIAKIVDGGAR
jgi:Tfp pilus assembly protein PilF